MPQRFKKAPIAGGAGELAPALSKALLAQGVELVLLDRNLTELAAARKRKTRLYFPRRTLWLIRLGRMLPPWIADRIAAAQIEMKQ
ncbi:MAG: hypothetical protein HYV27_14945 [Candidatus Hydrogenedentes bacterium]|nr:hypothetical protein [Candidatus Hydrogenedentota bacterium]